MYIVQATTIIMLSRVQYAADKLPRAVAGNMLPGDTVEPVWGEPELTASSRSLPTLDAEI